MEKSIKKNVCVCVYHFAAQQKLTQHCKSTMLQLKKKKVLGFPGGAVVNNPPANAGDEGSSPGPGSSHMPRSNEARAPQLLSLCSRARKPQLLSPRA